MKASIVAAALAQSAVTIAAPGPGGWGGSNESNFGGYGAGGGWGAGGFGGFGGSPAAICAVSLFSVNSSSVPSFISRYVVVGVRRADEQYPDHLLPHVIPSSINSNSTVQLTDTNLQ